MGPYSHYILAAKLEASLRPEQRAEYYSGAVAPDIRYLAQTRRETTHLGLDRLKELMTCYPHLRSFLVGYQVHLLIDQIDVSQVVNAAFPMNLLKRVMRRKISPQQMTMLVEMFYLQSSTTGGPLGRDHNEVFSGLGITPEQTSAFYRALREYFDSRTFDAAVSAFQKIGMIENARLEKYKAAYRTVQNQKVINSLFMLSIKNAGLDSLVMDHVRAGMSANAL